MLIPTFNWYLTLATLYHHSHRDALCSCAPFSCDCRATRKTKIKEISNAKEPRLCLLQHFKRKAVAPLVLAASHDGNERPGHSDPLRGRDLCRTRHDWRAGESRDPARRFARHERARTAQPAQLPAQRKDNDALGRVPARVPRPGPNAGPLPFALQSARARFASARAHRRVPGDYDATECSVEEHDGGGRARLPDRPSLCVRTVRGRFEPHENPSRQLALERCRVDRETRRSSRSGELLGGGRDRQRALGHDLRRADLGQHARLPDRWRRGQHFSSGSCLSNLAMRVLPETGGGSSLQIFSWHQMLFHPFHFCVRPCVLPRAHDSGFRISCCSKEPASLIRCATANRQCRVGPVMRRPHLSVWCVDNFNASSVHLSVNVRLVVGFVRCGNLILFLYGARTRWDQFPFAELEPIKTSLRGVQQFTAALVETRERSWFAGLSVKLYYLYSTRVVLLKIPCVHRKPRLALAYTKKTRRMHKFPAYTNVLPLLTRKTTLHKQKHLRHGQFSQKKVQIIVI